MSHHRRGENRPALSGRAARRADQRCDARNTAKKHGMPVIGHVQRAVVAASRDGWLFARDYLAGLGMDERFASAFGKACVKAYRANHGTDPDCGGKSIVNGRIRATYRYSNELNLIAGALAYSRTSGIVLTIPGHPLAHQFAGV